MAYDYLVGGANTGNPSTRGGVHDWIWLYLLNNGTFVTNTVGAASQQ